MIWKTIIHSLGKRTLVLGREVAMQKKKNDLENKYHITVNAEYFYKLN